MARQALRMGEVIPIRTAQMQRWQSDGQRLERGAATGQLVRIRRGAYIDQDDAATASPAALHLARVVATRLAARGEPTFSHESAAALHRIPVLGPWPARVHTTVVTRATSTDSVQRSVRPLSSADRVELDDGTLATTPVRTALDLAATGSLLGGIIAISHVRGSGVPLAEFEAALGRAGRFPGLLRARDALSRSTAGSRSVLETIIIVRCQDYGFAAPEQRHVARGVDGTAIEVDLAWEDGAILADGDPRDKLESDPAGTRRADRSESLERQRADALRTVCRTYLRIGWGEAWGGLGLLRLLADAGVPRPVRRLGALTR